MGSSQQPANSEVAEIVDNSGWLPSMPSDERDVSVTSKHFNVHARLYDWAHF